MTDLTAPEKVSCPACGSTDVATSFEPGIVEVPYGEPRAYRERVDVCRVCHESGDFSGQNEDEIQAALGASLASSMPIMLEKLANADRSMAYIERALMLPQRTLARWKNGDYSAAGAALMRLVATFPWLLEVADARFAPRVANAAVLAAASNILLSGTQPAHVVAPAVTNMHITNVNIGEVSASGLPTGQRSTWLHSAQPAAPQTQENVSLLRVVG
jgi:hypothetical protein